MRDIAEVKIGEKTYTVRELTLTQITDFISLQHKDIGEHVIDFLFGDVISARVISMSTGVSLDDLASLADNPSEIVSLIDCVKELNPFLSKALERKKLQDEENLKKVMELGPELMETLIKKQISVKK